MQSTLTGSGQPAVQLPVMVAADIQDSLLVVMHDLQRLEGLLNHATDNLLARFDEANALLDPAAAGHSGKLMAAREVLRSAVTELQFHDLASQLISHTTRALQACAFRLANETMGHEDGEVDAPLAVLAPQRPNPVTQSEMDAGSVELF
jgi:hypothetical protein